MSSDDNEERVLKRLTVRELRARAVKALGSKVAAGLKLKQELVDALVARAAKAVGKKSEPAPKKTPPKKEAAKATKKAEAAAPKKEEAPAKKAAAAEPAPKKTPPRKRATPPKAAAKTAAPAEKPVPPPRITKPSKAQAMAEVYELPITRDFFVDPKRPSLPASYGDDRLLCFRREPLAIVVSWDLSAATFADGDGLVLELVTLPGKLVGSVQVTAPTGLATFDELPEGEGLAVQVVRRGRVMTRGRPFYLGSAKQPAEQGGAWQMTVPVDEPLPDEPARQAWADAPAPAPSQRAKKARPSSSRLSS
jgi:hypothetical protein